MAKKVITIYEDAAKTTPLYPRTLSTAVSTSDGVLIETKIAAKQDTLVSGTNIKTINNHSILGSGNLDINSYTIGNGLKLTGNNLSATGLVALLYSTSTEQVLDVVVCTTAEYEAMASHSPTTLYIKVDQ